ncbi:MAG: ribonuclease D [Deltaproteobacteria bacterium]|nr:ribonuclease D [Deltaproteobacteria bacterium]MBW2586256.1 ribonuclease D [Deltaproteobacteria bacterium]
MPDFDWITNQAELDSLVDELSDTRAYALDTEFHRERTYLPQLALVQLATRERIALVDALAVDVRPLSRVFQSNAVCVMHAGSQDLEILELVSGTVPQRMFDTQIAALFCGYRTSSLGRLVEGFLGIELDKSAQLSDWTRRPLPEADLRYAASDVAHLLELRDTLVGRLDDRGRLQWAEEEIERLRSKDRSAPDPATLWWKLRGKTKLNGRACGVAQELAAWRDQVAKKQNRPPRTVLSDMALLALAQRPARNTEQLRGVRNFDLGRFKHTDQLLAAIQRGTQLPRDEIRLPPKKPDNLPNVDGVIALCLAWLAQRAGEEDLDMSVLGTRDDVTSLVLHQPSRLANGWRDTLVGRELRSIIDGTAGLRVNGTALELLDRVPS